MKRFAITLIAATLCAAFAPAPASAEFGLAEFEVSFTEADGSSATQAGSHPFAMRTVFAPNTIEDAKGKVIPEDAIKDILISQVPGFAGSPLAVPRCSTLDFLTTIKFQTEKEGELLLPECSEGSAVGYISVLLSPGAGNLSPVYLLEPAPGTAAKLGFWIAAVPVTVDIVVDESPPHNIVGASRNISQIVDFFGADLTLWGVPASSAHDEERGSCRFWKGKSCPAGVAELPFLTMPRACEGPLPSTYELDSWQNPGVWLEGSALTHDASGNPQGMNGCGKLDFSPRIESKATTLTAETGTGLDFSLDFTDEGLTNPTGIAQSDVKKVVVTLPEGVTVNPSTAEGLEVCAPSQLANENAFSNPGEGCPNASKIGSVSVDTPLVEERIEGSVYLAQQDDPATSKAGAENPFDTLIAFYIVLTNRDLGVSVKLPAQVEPDPQTGQLITTVSDAPQIPFSHFNFHFREGARAPLITPPACGAYTTKAVLTPWANPTQPLTATSTFEITRGIDAGPCPPGGVPPFKPGYEAGSLNNNAGSHSPFYMRLIRSDGEQNMTKFSSVLPPGVIGSLVGVSKCSDQAVEEAKAKTGRQELAAPSCPASSRIGRTLAGAGVGGVLVHVGGQLYLGGPYKGAPLSVIAVTPAVAGPFDAGTVVVREALDLNPETAEVEVDGAASDPIPHILKGIPLKLRDLRVYVDRPNFILNPTSCDPSSAKATLFGSHLDLFSPSDDVPVDLSARYQAANCLNLGFKPKLRLKLRGGTKRGDHPGLKAVLTPRPGDANIAAATATLPRSAFLEQAHIRTICTRVQFAAEACPKGSIYGKAKAWTPLLEEPFEGPVILRSSSNKLPDLVLALKGLVDVNVVSRIDSFKGGIRNSFEVVPDAPVSKFVLTLQGGDKGLIVNSRDLCEGKTSRASVRLRAHNGMARTLRPQLEPRCGGAARDRGSR